VPFRPDIDHIELILGSGTNIVTSLYMLTGDGYGADVHERIADACARGESSLYASGIYPGHAPMVALAASAMCQRIDHLSILESLDISGYENEAMLRAMGFDLHPDDPDAVTRVEGACGSFRSQLLVMAQALDVRVDAVRIDVDLAASDRTQRVGPMTIQAGHVAGIRGAVVGVVGAHARLECQFVWNLGDDMTPTWPVEHGYRIEIRGEPDLTCRLEPAKGHLDGAATTAAPLINAIPSVCAAPPGIVNRSELPFVRARHPFTGSGPVSLGEHARNEHPVA
jgi:hypothetical protein